MSAPGLTSAEGRQLRSALAHAVETSPDFVSALTMEATVPMTVAAAKLLRDQFAQSIRSGALLTIDHT